jgi:hypothetical protein
MHTIYKIITYNKLAFLDYSYDTIYPATFSVVTLHSFLDARLKYKNKLHYSFACKLKIFAYRSSIFMPLMAEQ